MKNILLLMALTFVSVSAFSQSNSEVTNGRAPILTLENTKCFFSVETKSLGAKKTIPMTLSDSMVGYAFFGEIKQGPRSYGAMARGGAVAKGEIMVFSVEFLVKDETGTHGKSIHFSRTLISGNLAFNNVNPIGSFNLNNSSSDSDELKMNLICGLNGKIQAAIQN